LRVRRDVPTPSPAPTHRLDWDTDPELAQFAGLSEHERMRVIIRVLCGLVALEEVPAAPLPARPHPAATAAVEPSPPAAPKRRRLLPFLGYENPGLAAPVAAPAPAELPAVGVTWPMGDRARSRRPVEA
jgi:hypothetical protein